MLGDRPLSDRARQLLADERGRVEDEAIKSRALERARAAVQGERPSGVGFRDGRFAEPHAPPRRWLRTTVLSAAAVAVAGLAAAGATSYVWPTPSAEMAPARLFKGSARPALRPAARGGLPQLEVAAPAPTERARERRAGAALPPASADARSLNVKQFAAELAVLEPARKSISRGDYAAALTALSQHRREFPNGQLSEEREALQVRALWGVGQRTAALSAAETFRKRYPRSGLLGWLKDRP